MQCTKQEVLDNLELVRIIAASMSWGHTNSLMSFDDLMSEGTLGLIKALESFNPEKGAKFSTYANYRIRGSILDLHRHNFKEYSNARLQGREPPIHIRLELDSLNEDEIIDQSTSEQELVNELDTRRFWQEVRQLLTQEQREILELLLTETTHAEMGRMRGIDVSRISQHCRRILGIVRLHHLKLLKKATQGGETVSNPSEGAKA